MPFFDFGSKNQIGPLFSKENENASQFRHSVGKNRHGRANPEQIHAAASKFQQMEGKTIVKTNFDDITDDQISECLHKIGLLKYRKNLSDLKKIAVLAREMNYWKSWLGPPVTHFQLDGSDYDGNHRVRAVKYLATTVGLQICIPVRFLGRLQEF